MRFDVIVVGAGPAGSTTARECATLGMTTLLLDRSEFPRDKPCGGGVNVRAARLLPFDLVPVAERSIRGMRISVKQRSAFARYATEPISYLTQRRVLDTYLVDKATERGVRFHPRMAVREVERYASHVVVRAGRETFEGCALVAADGANGSTAKLCGIRVALSKEIALEGNITSPAGHLDEWCDVFGIDVGSVPGGYGWLFPKGDHVNIGVGGLASNGPQLRFLLDTLCRSYGFNPKVFWNVRGHPLPVRLPGAAVADGNVVLVGDAAGLLDPLTGEGIYGAIWSGCAAARRLRLYLSGESPDLDEYRADVERDMEPDLITSRQLHRLFHLAPPLWAQFVRRSPRAWRLICALISGDVAYGDIKRRSRALAICIEGGAHGVRLAGERRPWHRRPGHGTANLVIHGRNNEDKLVDQPVDTKRHTWSGSG